MHNSYNEGYRVTLLGAIQQPFTVFCMADVVFVASLHFQHYVSCVRCSKLLQSFAWLMQFFWLFCICSIIQSFVINQHLHDQREIHYTCKRDYLVIHLLHSSKTIAIKNLMKVYYQLCRFQLFFDCQVLGKGQIMCVTVVLLAETSF